MAEDEGKTKHPSRYKPGNVAADGSYKVGRGRPPEHTRFAVGDGRRRGRRPKGQKNFDTEFQEEAKRRVTIREGGRERRVSKLRSVIIRAFDNAGSRGQNQAIRDIFNQAQKIADKNQLAGIGLDANEAAMIDGWIEQQIDQRTAGNNPGDPDPPVDSHDEASGPDNTATDDE